ncbi:LysR family transcriptional regulator [Yinghuangia aomiensis]
MELRQLRTFEAVVRHRTVTEAAAVLDLAPSTVSEHIRALERSLGVPVFERTARGMRVTPAGEVLRGWARRLLEQADQARREVAGAGRALRLGALETIAASHAPGVLSRIAARDPRVAVEVRPSRSRDALMEDVAAGVLDAALVLDTGEELGDLGFAPLSALAFADVEPMPLVLVAAADHPLRDADEVTLEDLRDERLLTNVPNCSFLLAADRVLGGALRRVRAEGVPVMRAWAEQGLGIALLPEFAVAQSLQAGTLTRLAFPVPPLQLRLIWGADQETRADVRELLYAVAAGSGRR